jgi:hypothetical protein
VWFVSLAQIEMRFERTEIETENRDTDSGDLAVMFTAIAQEHTITLHQFSIEVRIAQTVRKASRR